MLYCQIGEFPNSSQTTDKNRNINQLKATVRFLETDRERNSLT